MRVYMYMRWGALVCLACLLELLRSALAIIIRMTAGPRNGSQIEVLDLGLVCIEPGTLHA